MSGAPRMRLKRLSSRSVAWGLAGVLVLAGLSYCLLWYLRNPSRGLPYKDSFAEGSIDEWKAYGGSWGVVDGAMRNDSDEHGGKLITGSPYWKDYGVEADLQLFRTGDVGLIVRASDEERGVDAYSGYYAGIRTWGTSYNADLQNRLVIGLAKHGWVEYSTIPIPGGVRPSEWYHLRVVAFGCTIVATATNPRTGASITASARPDTCFRTGRIGLRSFGTGGIWKNVQVREVHAPVQDLGQVSTEPLPPFGLKYAPGSAESELLAPTGNSARVPKTANRQTVERTPPKNYVRTVSNLRLLPSVQSTAATVRGVVVLTAPEIYVQDSTGGVAVPNPNGPQLRTGDEVEVTGIVEPHAFSATLRNATVRTLWEHEPIPPVAITAGQAATGAYDATFVQLEGILLDKAPGANGTWELTLEHGRQSFVAITNTGRGKEQLPRLVQNSILRVRGVCVVDPRYTRTKTPFVVLLPSTNAIEVVAGPPWWSLRYLLAILAASLVLVLLAYLLYMRVKHLRLCAILAERARLAHELHDTLAQSFAGIGFQLQAIRNRIPKDSKLIHEQLNQAYELVQHSHEEARRSIATLRPESLESSGLAAALQAWVNRIVEGGALQVSVSTSGTPVTMPLLIKDTLYRIGQEAIANAIRHAEPTVIKIELAFDRNAVLLSIEDNGCGFDPEKESSGFGLIGMRKRAESISAAMEIVSEGGSGTRIHVKAQLPPPITALNWLRYFIRNVVEGRSDGHARTNPYSYRR